MVLPESSLAKLDKKISDLQNGNLGPDDDNYGHTIGHAVGFLVRNIDNARTSNRVPDGGIIKRLATLYRIAPDFVLRSAGEGKEQLVRDLLIREKIIEE